MLNVPGITTASHVLLPQSEETVRVVVAGLDAVARAGVLSLLASSDDVAVVDDLDVDDRLTARLRVLAPDVVICDGDPAVVLPLMRGSVPVLMLVGETAGASEAIAGGARGVLARTASASRIEAAVRALREGLIVLDGETVPDLPREREVLPFAEPFTARETEVVQLLAAGLTNKEIAQRLGITEHTVKFHVNAILGKLGAQTRTEAVVQAAKRGIVAL